MGRLNILHPRFDKTSAFGFPLRTVVKSKANVFVAGNSKHSAFLQLVGQWEDAVVKKPKLPFGSEGPRERESREVRKAQIGELACD